MEIRTRRLIIRSMTIKDYQAWKMSMENSLPKQNIWDREKLKPDEITYAKFRELLKNLKSWEGKFCDRWLGLFHKKTGDFVGLWLYLSIQRQLLQETRIAYEIQNNYWNQGYGKEVMKALIKNAFKNMKLYRVYFLIHPKNMASIALIKSVGARYEGLRKKAMWYPKLVGKEFKGFERTDMKVFAITKGET